jgi:DTW domain-containing protein YfiP
MQKAPVNSMAPEACKNCLKQPELCMCDRVHPVKTGLHVLILQHPQEPDKELGSAQLAHLALPNSTLKIGLSWANLKKALGREVHPSNWAVLHLGSGIKGKLDPRVTPAGRLQFVNKVGMAIPAPLEKLEGIVILDGSWSQAKTLWWRNGWLLKLKRVVLTPQYKSLYRELRKEPRHECLSTIESIAECLSSLGEPAETEKVLKTLFSELLDKQRTRLKERKQANQQQRVPKSLEADASTTAP